MKRLGMTGLALTVMMSFGCQPQPLYESCTITGTPKSWTAYMDKGKMVALRGTEIRENNLCFYAPGYERLCELRQSYPLSEGMKEAMQAKIDAEKKLDSEIEKALKNKQSK